MPILLSLSYMMTPRGHLKRYYGTRLRCPVTIVSDENNRVIKQSSQLCLKLFIFQIRRKLKTGECPLTGFRFLTVKAELYIHMP